MLKKWISSDESLQLENFETRQGLKCQSTKESCSYCMASAELAMGRTSYSYFSKQEVFLNQIRKNILFFEKYQKPVFLKDTISESLKKTFYAQWMTRAMLARTSEVF